MFSRYALFAFAVLPLAACGNLDLPFNRDATTPAVQGHQGPPGVSPLDQPIETGAAAAQAVSTVDPSTYNIAAFSARGVNPAWSADAAGTTAIYRMGDAARARPVRVSRLAFAEGVEYIGTVDNRPFVLTLRSGDCRDAGTGQRFDMTATMKLSGRTLQGCAGPATAEVATAVAATRAPAPAAPTPVRRRTAAPAATPAPAAAAATAPATTTPAATTPATPAPTTTTPAPDLPAPTAASPAAPANPAATTTAPAPATPAPTTPAPSTPIVPAPAMVLPTTPPTTPAADAPTQ